MDTIIKQPYPYTDLESPRWSRPWALTLEPKPSPHLGARPLVSRVALLDLLERSRHASVIAVLAPPGYGKTTLLSQWADRDPRRFGWVAIDQDDNDPAVLFRKLDAVVPELGSALAAAAEPLVLVLDDLHLLQNRDGLQLVGKLIDDLPMGSQLVIASREEPPLPLARLRAEGRVLGIGPEDLAMDQREAGALLENAELGVDPVDELLGLAHLEEQRVLLRRDGAQVVHLRPERGERVDLGRRRLRARRGRQPAGSSPWR